MVGDETVVDLRDRDGGVVQGPGVQRPPPAVEALHLVGEHDVGVQVGIGRPGVVVVERSREQATGLDLRTASGADAGAIVSADEPMAITLHIISDKITSDRMVEATEEGFEHSTGGNTAPLKESIDAFMAFFREPIANGDVFEIGYVPPSGEIRVSKNGEPKGAVPGGLPFKRAVFGIWLGDKPAQKSLRDQMLGR